jgi:hypothetical protein
MKKCLHLKKTKPHWRRKPPKVVTWRDRLEAEKRTRHARILLNHPGALMTAGIHSGIGAMAALRMARTINTSNSRGGVESRRHAFDGSGP